MPTAPLTGVTAFSSVSDAYVRARPTYPAAFFRALALLAPTRRIAWDCGTGNGQAAIGLADHFEHVEATDASAEQIAKAISHPRVRYATAPAEASCLLPATVDLVSVAQAAHWFDRPRFYNEVRRVSRPGAVIALYGYSWFYVSPTIDDLTRKFLLEPVAAFWSPQNALLWDGYRTIEFPFDELPPLSLAIHLSWTLEQLFAYYATWSATQRKLAANGDGFLKSAHRVFADAWGDPAVPRPIVMPLAIRWGRTP